MTGAAAHLHEVNRSTLGGSGLQKRRAQAVLPQPQFPGLRNPAIASQRAKMSFCTQTTLTKPIFVPWWRRNWQQKSKHWKPSKTQHPCGLKGNRRYAKWPLLELVAQPLALPGRWHALRAAVCASLCLSWHLCTGQALRALLWSVAYGQSSPVSPRPSHRSLAATRHWPPGAGLPVYPPKGAPSVQRTPLVLEFRQNNFSFDTYV